jgi:hypothetical protein
MQVAERNQEQNRKSCKEMFNTPPIKSNDIMTAFSGQRYLTVPRFGSMISSADGFKFPIDKLKSTVKVSSFISNKNFGKFNRRSSNISAISAAGINPNKRSIEEMFVNKLNKSSNSRE